MYEGIEIARKHQADLLLAVGGGSVCDYAKAVSVSVNCKEDPWEKYYLRFEEPDCETLPVGCVLTMAGTGSEMNAGAVITNPETKQKIGHVFADEKIMPRFAILNPKYTLTLPHYQMAAGIYDIFNHICEQYFSGEDDNVSDYISEGLMRSLLHSSRIANKNPQDYEARSNIMWTATWALNTLVAKGKSTDWMVHMLGQAVGAYTNATHGMTLAAVSLPYYRYIMPYGLPKFKRLIRRLMMLTNKADCRSSDSGRYRNNKFCHKTSSFFYLTEEAPSSFITGRFYPYFKPLTSGMRQSRRTMPMIPTRMPGIIMFQTITIHMPMPSARAPTTPSSTDPTALPLRWIAGLHQSDSSRCSSSTRADSMLWFSAPSFQRR